MPMAGSLCHSAGLDRVRLRNRTPTPRRARSECSDGTGFRIREGGYLEQDRRNEWRTGRRGSVYPAKLKGRYGYHKTCARPGRIGSVARSASDRLGSPNLGRCCRYLGAPDHGGKKQPGGSRFAGASIASSSFWLPIQPSSGLLRHETGRRSDRGASRVRSAKTVPRPASEMGDLGCVYMAGHELQSA
jgi:hypothetical protein